MVEAEEFYVVKKKAVPDVLLKVVEAKRLLESGRIATIQEAADVVNISRSSFYKYKDDIFQFHDNSQGTTFTITFQMDDERASFGRAKGHCLLRSKHSDDPSEYSDKRNGFFVLKYSDLEGYRQCFGYRFKDRRRKGRSFGQTCGKRIKIREYEMVKVGVFGYERWEAV